MLARCKGVVNSGVTDSSLGSKHTPTPYTYVTRQSLVNFGRRPPPQPTFILCLAWGIFCRMVCSHTPIRGKALAVGRAHRAKARFSPSKEVAKQAKQKTLSKKAAAQAAKLSEEASRRWFSEVSERPREILMRDRPHHDDVYCFVDNKNGRFLIGYRNHTRKSFSWGLRGDEAAVRLALRQLWEWHSQATGERPPAHMRL